MPKLWRDREVEKQEELELKIKQDTINFLEIQEKLKKAEIDSDEDDLIGWEK